MRNLYSITTTQEAMRALFRTSRDRAGNLPPKYALFPDYEAPVIRTDPDGERAIDVMRWGISGPPQFGGKPVTNVRNVKSSHWRPWLNNRCLVPATAFSEYTEVPFGLFVAQPDENFPPLTIEAEISGVFKFRAISFLYRHRTAPCWWSVSPGPEAAILVPI